MSWSIQKIIGEPAKVRVAVEPQFDREANRYKGTAEEVDVLNVKGQVLAFLDGVPAGSAAMVEASGSRGAGWLTVRVDCSAIKLA